MNSHMKSTGLFILLLTGLVFSCTYTPEQDRTASPPAEKEADETQRAIDPSIEAVLKQQLNEYLTAFTTGDIEKSIYYLYPDMFEWMRRTASEYGESFENDDVKEWFGETIADMEKMKKERGIEFSWSLDPIEKIVESENVLLYISVTSLIGIMGYDEIKMGDETVCISTDSGKNWKFLSNNPESTPNILRIRFPADIVRKITSRY